jgi:hypothetical protein
MSAMGWERVMGMSKDGDPPSTGWFVPVGKGQVEIPLDPYRGADLPVERNTQGWPILKGASE